ncbi:HDOD domain-containing protein [Thiolapillus sp.]|uniref:HDOD domain-containing protein n=1 Tax=Thiolapillus sp. TaxID=2017437 RepID=UPI00273966F2
MQQQHVDQNLQEREFCFLQDLTRKLASREIDLPPFPDIYARIIRTIHDPDVSLQDVSRIVVAAPDLCVRILLLANSALLNRSGIKVTDLNIAVSRLGLSAVNSATVTLATKDVFKAPKGSSLEYLLNKTRMESVKVAAYSYLLAIRAGLREEKHNAMLAGLLHNIGTYYILSMAGGFPESISTAIERQDEIELARDEDIDELRDILICAILLAREANNTATEETDYDRIPACQALNINSENVPQIIEEYREEVSSFVSALK